MPYTESVWKRGGTVENKTAFSLKKIVNIAVTEYVKWICNPRMIMVAAMFVFIYDYIIREMKEASDMMSSEIMIFEPFIAICNSELLMLIVPAVYIAVMGDFPRIDGNSLFYVFRAGRTNWIMGQVLFLCMSAVTYIGMVFVMSVLSIASYMNVNMEWSDVVTQFGTRFPEKAGGKVVQLITGRMYNNFTPAKACCISALLMLLYLIVIGMMLLTGFVLKKRAIGIGITGAVISIGCGCIVLKSKLKWLFPAANALPWLHFDMVYNRQFYRLEYSVIYMVALIVVAILADIVFMDDMDISKVESL